MLVIILISALFIGVIAAIANKKRKVENTSTQAQIPVTTPSVTPTPATSFDNVSVTIYDNNCNSIGTDVVHPNAPLVLYQYYRIDDNTIYYVNALTTNPSSATVTFYGGSDDCHAV